MTTTTITATLLPPRSSSSSQFIMPAASASGPPRRSLRIRDDHRRRPPPMMASSCSSSSTSGGSGRWKHEEDQDARTPLVVIVGATGTGKTKLSIDAALAFNGEVVNADKIQLYAGLDVTTNKAPPADRRGVPHHLLGALRPDAGALPPSSFRALASSTCASIASRGRVPVVAGGSNSLIHALLAKHPSPDLDPFSDDDERYRPALRHPCCILWVDVEEALLADHLDARVDEMLRGGMVEELREYFRTTAPADRAAHAPGLGRAIGVPELGGYLAGAKTLETAVEEIKANTRVLAAAQARKIRRMADGWGWPVRRLDASAAIRARLAGDGAEAEAESWERDVRGPGLAAIRDFLDAEEEEAAPCGRDASVRVEEPPQLLMRLPRMQCCDMVV